MEANGAETVEVGGQETICRAGEEVYDVVSAVSED